MSSEGSGAPAQIHTVLPEPSLLISQNMEVDEGIDLIVPLDSCAGAM